MPSSSPFESMKTFFVYVLTKCTSSQSTRKTHFNMADGPTCVKQTECHFSRIPVEIVEKIMSYLSPYGDFFDAKCVCRLWYRLIVRICKQRLQNFHAAVRTGNLRIRTLTTKSRISPLPRFSHGCCIIGGKMYVHGGCSSSNTAFNDLYFLDLREQRWIRPRTSGSPPPPKECATAVVYDNRDIVIFGGWCQPSRTGINSVAKFFDDLYIFNIVNLSWRSPAVNRDLPRPCKRAGHGACVLGHKMIVFGGAQRELRLGLLNIRQILHFGKLHTCICCSLILRYQHTLPYPKTKNKKLPEKKSYL